MDDISKFHIISVGFGLNYISNKIYNIYFSTKIDTFSNLLLTDLDTNKFFDVPCIRYTDAPIQFSCDFAFVPNTDSNKVKMKLASNAIIRACDLTKC